MDQLKFFKLMGNLEGISYLLILLVTMPLKYFMAMPTPNKIVGMAHGVLFIVYCLLLLMVMSKYKLGFKVGFIGFIAALLPFGPFVFHSYMMKHIKTES